MPVMRLHCLAPEVKNACLVPVVVNDHWNPGTSTHRKSKWDERPCSIATIDKSLSIEMKEKLKTKLKERYNGLRRYYHARDTRLDWLSDRGSFGMFVLDEVVPTFTRELGSTGDDQGLSAPVDFDSIRSQSLPIGREDVNDNPSFDMVRVPLQAAVRFIADLHRREETAFQDLRRSTINMPTGLTYDSTTTKAERYADEMIQKAEEEGYNNVFEVKYELELMQQPVQKELSRDEEL